MNTRRSGSEHTVAYAADSRPDLYPINAKICQLVQQFPCMYDRSHSHYLKKDVVDKAWVKISKEMNDSIPSCKERWRNIRTSFARSINVRKIPASANRTKPYYLHEELKFLTHHITPGVPVPRRVAFSKKSSSQNSSTFDDEESEEIKISFSEESFDSFAALAHEASEDDGGDDTDADTDETHAETSEECNNTYNEEMHNSNGDDIQVNNYLNSQSNRTVLPIVTTGEALVDISTPAAVEVAPIMQTNVCPCPPKKRLRLVEAMQTPDLEFVATLDNDTKTSSASLTQPSAPQELGRIGLNIDVDFDDAFLQGLRPEMKAMNFQQKVYFKRGIYDLLGEIFPHSSSLDSSPPLTNSPKDQQQQSLDDSFNTTDLQVLRRLSNLLHQQFPSVSATASHTAHFTMPPYQYAAQHSTPTILLPPRLRSVARPANVTNNAVGSVSAAPHTQRHHFFLNSKTSLSNAQQLKEEAPDPCDML